MVRGEMCVFSQTCVKAEAQGNGLRVGEAGHTMHRQQRLERSQQQSDCRVLSLSFLVFSVFQSAAEDECGQSAFHSRLENLRHKCV